MLIIIDGNGSAADCAARMIKDTLEYWGVECQCCDTADSGPGIEDIRELLDGDAVNIKVVKDLPAYHGRVSALVESDDIVWLDEEDYHVE